MEKIYCAEKDVVDLLHKTRDKVHGVCRQYMNRPVRVETVDGEMFEGMIVNVDRHHIYVQHAVPTQGPLFRSPYPYSPRAYYPPYNPYAQQILPLVLFNLLAITLI